MLLLKVADAIEHRLEVEPMLRLQHAAVGRSMSGQHTLAGESTALWQCMPAASNWNGSCQKSCAHFFPVGVVDAIHCSCVLLLTSHRDSDLHKRSSTDHSSMLASHTTCPHTWWTHACIWYRWPRTCVMAVIEHGGRFTADSHLPYLYALLHRQQQP